MFAQRRYPSHLLSPVVLVRKDLVKLWRRPNVVLRVSGQRQRGRRRRCRWRADRLGDPLPPGDPANYSSRRVPVKAVPIRPDEDRALEALTDGEVDRPGSTRGRGDRRDLASLRVMVSVRWPLASPS